MLLPDPDVRGEDAGAGKGGKTTGRPYGELRCQRLQAGRSGSEAKLDRKEPVQRRKQVRREVVP